jgi:hypothetical protein
MNRGSTTQSKFATSGSECGKPHQQFLGPIILAYVRTQPIIASSDATLANAKERSLLRSWQSFS